MTYIDLINSFWKKHNQKHFDEYETTFYFFLLNECNARQWLNPFGLRTSYIEECLELPRKTITDIRLRLTKRGLLSCLEGKAKRPTVYFIREQDFTNSEFKKKDFNVRQNKSNVTLMLPGVTLNPNVTHSNIRNLTEIANDAQNADSKEDVKPNVTLMLPTETLESNVTSSNIRVTLDQNTPYKDIKTIKSIDSQYHRGAKKIESENLFPDEKPERKKKAKPPEPAIPTLEEVRSYFQSQRADERLQNWEVEADKFFYHYNALGWHNAAGTRIAHWDSMANKWIINQEQNEQKQRTTINQRGDATKGLRAKLPPKPGCGLIEPDDDY